jgi:hypothetical protein
MKAYRCDKCGEFHTGQPGRVGWTPRQDKGDDWERGWEYIDLCPDCAVEVIFPLAVIAKTEKAA